MVLHLFRTGVGVEDFDHLKSLMTKHIFEHKGQKVRAITTRYRPKDYEDILKEGGSLYWIIKGMICARQPIVDFVLDKEENGKSFCRILLSPKVVRTQSYPHRAIQGWRYLKEDKAPKDIEQGDVDTSHLPSDLVKDLRFLGLL